MAEQIIAIIGAGGKTTAMELLAAQAVGPVLVTTTTHIFPMTACPCLIDPQAQALTQALKEHALLCAGSSSQQGKLKCLPPPVLAAGMEASRTMIYEADGSKHHPLKLHHPDEPVVLPETTALLVVAGLSALGKPVSQVVHRYDLNPSWAQNPGQCVDTEIFLQCVEETVSSSGLPHDRIRVFLNQADTCPDSTIPELLCQHLRQKGLSAQSGSLQKHPAAFYTWVTAKEI